VLATELQPDGKHLIKHPTGEWEYTYTDYRLILGFT